MWRALINRISGAIGTIILLVLGGCTGSLKMPINEYSHVQAEATPLKSQFEVSYHLYEALPHLPQADWQAKIKFDVIGTVYDSDEIGSPAARRLEAGWERLWEDGRPDWATIERMITDETALLDTKREPKAAEMKSKAYTPYLGTEAPMAGLHLFIFSSKPGW